MAAVSTLIKTWAPTIGIWSAAVGVGLLYFGEGIPLFNRDIFSKLPIFGKRYKSSIEE